jgi:hypothetical protein
MDLNHNLANSTNTTRDYEERGEAAERPLDMIHTSSPNILLTRDTYFPYEHTPKHAYPGTARVGHDYHHDDFRVQSGHFKKKFQCPTSLKNPKTNESCPYKVASRHADDCLDRDAHWFCQTEAQAHLWTPEIFDSFTTPITITRIISSREFDKAREDAKKRTLVTD